MKKRCIIVLLIAGLASCRRGPGNGDFPAFNIILPDSSIVNTATLPDDKPVLFMVFSPDCEHCQKETADILKNIDSFKQMKLLFVTLDPLIRLKVYNTYYHIPNYSNITIGKDASAYIISHYQHIPPPYMILFDKEHRFRAMFKGETEVTQILSFFNTI